MRGSEIKNIESTINWKGKGIYEDPYIIDSAEDFLTTFKTSISNFNDHVIIRNCEFQDIKFSFYSCSNFTFENCIFHTLYFEDCESFKILDCKISRELSLFQCYKFIIQKSSILHLIMKRSYSNEIEGCEISKIEGFFNKNNKFLGNQIPLLFHNEFKKKSNINIQKKNIKCLLIAVSIPSLIILPILFARPDIFIPSLIATLIIISLFILLILGVGRERGTTALISKRLNSLPSNIYERKKGEEIGL